MKVLQSFEAVKTQSLYLASLIVAAPMYQISAFFCGFISNKLLSLTLKKGKGVEFFKWRSWFTYNWIAVSLAHQWRNIRFRFSINKTIRGRLHAFRIFSLLLEESQNWLVRRGFIWFHHRDDNIIPIIISEGRVFFFPFSSEERVTYFGSASNIVQS